MRVRAACVCCVAEMVRVRAACVCCQEMVRVRATYVRRVAEMLRVRAAHECCACACIPGKPILSCRYPQAGHSEVDLRAVGELAEPAPLSLFGLGPTPHSLSGLGPPPTLTPWPGRAANN